MLSGRSVPDTENILSRRAPVTYLSQNSRELSDPIPQIEGDLFIGDEITDCIPILEIYTG